MQTIRRATPDTPILFDFQEEALRVGIEFRSIHALNISDSRLVGSLVLNTAGIFEDVGAFGKVVDKVVARGVTVAFVVSETVLIPVAGENFRGLGSASALILEVNIFHVPIGPHLNPDDKFSSNFEGLARFYRFEDRSLF